MMFSGIKTPDASFSSDGHLPSTAEAERLFLNGSSTPNSSANFNFNESRHSLGFPVYETLTHYKSGHYQAQMRRDPPPLPPKPRLMSGQHQQQQQQQHSSLPPPQQAMSLPYHFPPHPQQQQQQQQQRLLPGQHPPPNLRPGHHPQQQPPSDFGPGGRESRGYSVSFV